MTMRDVSFDTTTHKLEVMYHKVGQSTVVNLARDTNTDPAVKTGPGGYGAANYSATAFASFDGSQPWNILQGKAFSRRLGWNPGTNTSAAVIQTAYTADASIWIESMSHSAELETYQAVGMFGVNIAGTLDANNVPIIDVTAHGYEAIFGTANSSTKWQWDYQMDHNVVAVPPSYLTDPSATFTATYRVYVGDSLGNDLDASNAALETWTWNAPVPVPEPASVGLIAGAAFGVLSARKRRTE